MKRSLCSAWCLLAVLPCVAAAQPVLYATHQLGQRCSSSRAASPPRPPLVGGLYGPALSKEAAGGRADVVRDVISNGTPRMPGFKYTYDANQIAAIAAYLAIMPAPAPARPQGAPRDDN